MFQWIKSRVDPLLFGVIFSALLFSSIVLAGIWGCSRRQVPVIRDSVASSEVRRLYFAGHYENLSCAQYSKVDYAWLTSSYRDQFSKRLFADNITQWDNKFECNLFADYYKTYASIVYYNEFYSSFAGTRQLAIGEIWYHPDWAKNTGHAINFAITERGLIFVEPQTGGEVHLSRDELNSIYFIEM